MALKAMFDTLKQEGYVVKPLDQYLLSLSAKDSDRAINVNAPSQCGKCMRENYYARTGAEVDGYTIDARTRRIFDNGTKTHERLQEYMLKCGLLLMDEVPLRNDEYQIQGHTDGFLKLTPNEVGILEIKSINSNGFSALKSPKPEHILQGHVYMYCSEQRRLYLRGKYTKDTFKSSMMFRRNQFKKNFKHLKDGAKYTRAEKLSLQLSLCMKADEILFNTSKPVNKVVFLYEDKNSQELKEFTVTYDEAIMSDILKGYAELNEYVKSNTIPPRGASKKSDMMCKWCNFRLECWG